MDQGRTVQSAYRVDGDLEGQVCGPLELLWNHMKSPVSENGQPRTVRGAPGNRRSYRDPGARSSTRGLLALAQTSCKVPVHHACVLVPHLWVGAVHRRFMFRADAGTILSHTQTRP